MPKERTRSNDDDVAYQTVGFSIGDDDDIFPSELTTANENGTRENELEHKDSSIDNGGGDDDNEQKALSPKLEESKQKTPRIAKSNINHKLAISDDMTPSPQKKIIPKRRRNIVGWCWMIVLSVLSFLCVFTMNLLSSDESQSNVGVQQMRQTFVAAISPKGALATLKVYTEKSRLAGTNNSYEMAQYIKKSAISFGFKADWIRIHEYEAVLNVPINISVEVNNSIYTTYMNNGTENTSIGAAFHMYSKNGTVTGDLLYVNYGRTIEYKALKNNNIVVSGKIVLIRRGIISDAAKINIAAKYGAIGALLYNDPADDGSAKGETLPNGPWRPGSDVSPGSVYLEYAEPYDIYADEITVRKNDSLPSIVSIPISSDYAKTLIKLMSINGTKASDIGISWNGGIADTYYVESPGLTATVNNIIMYNIKKIYNLVITIEGSVEHDRYVIVGSRRDSYVGAAVTPGSAVASFVEILRGLGKLIHGGWQPLRSVILASWDADEYGGSTGSMAWMEELGDYIASRTVLYLILESPVIGVGKIKSICSPSLRSVLHEIEMSIKQPQIVHISNRTGNLSKRKLATTSKDFYSAVTRGNISFLEDYFINTGNLGSVYTYMMNHTEDTVNLDEITNTSLLNPFLAYYGIPIIKASFDGGYYGVKDSVYDSISWMSDFGDPTYEFHRAIAQIYGSILLSFSDAVFLPFNFETYASRLLDGINILQEKVNSNDTTQDLSSLNFTSIRNSVSSFSVAAKNIKKEMKVASDETMRILDGQFDISQEQIRRINDRLALTERAFLLQDGLPDVPWSKHGIYGPVVSEDFVIKMFPSIYEAINRKDKTAAKRQIKAITHLIDDATTILSSGMQM